MGPKANGMTCNDAMERFHRVLDGDLMDATARTRMDKHLAVCAECAERAAQLREMQDLLRGFAESPLPDEALQVVRARTVDAPRVAARRPRFDWRFAAAATAVLFVAWLGVQGPAPRRTGQHGGTEIHRRLRKSRDRRTPAP